MSVLRKAARPLSVRHGTRDRAASKKLLCSDVSGQGLDALIPDAILYAHGDVRGVVDAKYKRITRLQMRRKVRKLKTYTRWQPIWDAFRL